MIVRGTRSLVLLGCLAFAWPVNAQTTGTTGTGTTGATGATGGATGGAGGAGSNRVTSGGGGGSSGGSGSGFGNSGSSSGSGPFQGTVPASFSGSAGGSTSTNTTGGGRGISGTNAVPSTNNPWLSTYGNPYAIGQSVLGSGSTAKSAGVNKGFGQPLFSTSTTNIGTTAGLQQSNSNSGNGFNNSNISKTPRYTSALADDVPFVSHPPALLQAKLQDILSRSTTIRSDRVQVVVDGGTVFLLGQVGSERERRLAESMLRLTPGVVDIDNRLALPGQP